MSTIRAVVVDDQAVVRSGFVNLLATQEDIEVVGEGADGEDAIYLVREHHPDLALLDIRMPNTDGIAATRAILADPETATRVLILTTFGLDEYVYDALAAGASGFLLKDATFPELLHAVRVVAAGKAMLAPDITQRLITRFLRERPALLSRPETPDLTARETEVLLLVARGYSNDDIAERLTITDHTVKTHINRLFAKLGARDRAQAVIAAYELGYIAPGG
ncbi:response regulator [Streptomyces pacificus]|uniref:Response regulator transcription factor n=1 Tax=Streptomyces pacificus TaxID=2705029 RepID=A0A6A0B0E3_9ACTN|nr:response regulator transcription factor [Streptomyces pacificus]GFH37357.1 response regulator transcription factor [Streptomyces pacificus]